MKTFFLDPASWREPFEITGSEAHHLGRVLRTKAGETVRGIDGAGRSGEFSVTSIDKRRVELELLSETAIEAPNPSITLAVGWTKSARRGWLIEKSVELQASGLWFWRAARSQGRPPAEPKEKWQAAATGGAKQCGNPWLPNLRTLPSLDALKEAAQDFDRCYLLWEDQDEPSLLAPADVVSSSGKVLCVIGPEGGFTDEEVHSLRGAGFDAVSLGPSVLRVETAALAALSLFWWGGSHA